MKKRTPIVEALTQVMGRTPPEDLVQGCYYDFNPLGDAVTKLQDWCASHAPITWMTGLGAIEAAELLVKVAIENGNLLANPPEEEEEEPAPRTKRVSREGK